MTILITGGSGNLGLELKKIFKNSLCPTHEELDLTNKDEVDNYFKNHDKVGKFPWIIYRRPLENELKDFLNSLNSIHING